MKLDPPHELSQPPELTPEGKRLISLVICIQFGRIESLHIAGGQPVLDPLPRIVREIKFGSEVSPGVPADRSNSVPKRQVQELLDLMRQVENGVIDVLEVRHGLPFRVVLAAPSGLGGG